MAGKNQPVDRRGGDWAVLGAGNSRDTAHFDTEREAIARATKIARNQGSEVLIHGRNNLIRERNSYGNDLFPPRG